MPGGLNLFRSVKVGMRLITLLVAVTLSSPPALAQTQPASSGATRASSAEDAASTLPVSVERIREALAKVPDMPRLRGLNERPTFRVTIEERLAVEDLFKGVDFSPGPIPPGGIYAYEQQRLLSNPGSRPLAQPYAAFSGGELLTIALQNLVARYLARAFAGVQDRAEQAAAEREVEQAIRDYCAAQPNGGAAHRICTDGLFR